MKLHTIGRVAKATICSLAIGLGVTACSRDFTLAYVYTTTTKASPGLINAYGVDYQTGALLQLADSPIPSGGRNPVALVATPNGKFLYVVNRDDSNVVEFAVGSDGKLYAQNTYNVQGSFPTAIAIDPTGNYLYVTSLYQPGFTTANPGPGLITVFPIKTDNSLGSPVANGSLNYFPVGNNPVAIIQSPLTKTVGAPRYMYVIDQEVAPNANLLSFVVPVSSTGIPTGALTASSATTSITINARATPYGTKVGVVPAALAEDPTGKFVYVTDQSLNEIIGFVVQGTGGLLAPMVSSPFTTGLLPVAVTIDPRGLYLYTANFNANTVSAFVINPATGSLSGSSGSASTAVGTGPTCVTIEPARGIYLYTSNALDNTVTGEQLDPHNGGLKQVQNTPFAAAGLPSCTTSVANGSHPTQALDN
jgi:6-phosphogluconolactonase